MKTKREKVYDEEVFPLVAELIKICISNDIPLVACFQLNDDRAALEDEFYCQTTLVPAGAGSRITMAANILTPGVGDRVTSEHRVEADGKGELN